MSLETLLRSAVVDSDCAKNEEQNRTVRCEISVRAYGYPLVHSEISPELKSPRRLPDKFGSEL